MPRAWMLVGDPQSARFLMLAEGLAAAGFEPHHGWAKNAEPTDLLLTWNRYNRGETAALEAERRGCRVVVAENGYIGKHNTALALGHHVGAGTWPAGTVARFRRFGIEAQPWRRSGEHLLVCPQRGIGPAGVAMPKGWGEATVERLRAMTDRPVILRPHPGKDKTGPTLPSQLENAWATVVWASGAGVKSIFAGVPVFHDFPRWICACAARPLEGADLEDPYRGSRTALKQALANAQWTQEEIVTGEAFRCLLSL